MFKMPTKPQNSWQVLWNGVRFWRSHLGQLSLVTAFALIVSTLPAIFFPELNSLKHHELTRFVESNFIFVFIFAIVMFVIFAFVSRRTYSIMYQKDESLMSSLWVAFKKLPWLLVALIIYDVFVIGGFILLVIPGIGLSILLSLYFLLIITDDLNPMSAFKRSWDLISPYWFHAFSVLLVMTVVIVSLTIFIKTGTRDIWVIAHPASTGIFDLGNRIIRVVSGTLFYGVFVSILLMLTHDLKLREKSNAEL